MAPGLVEQQLGIAAGGQADQAGFGPGKSSATLTVLVPMEPVLPSRTTFFMVDIYLRMRQHVAQVQDT